MYNKTFSVIVTNPINGYKIGPQGVPITIKAGERVLLLGNANAWFVIGWNGIRVYTLQAPLGYCVEESNKTRKEKGMYQQVRDETCFGNRYFPKGTTLKVGNLGAVIDVVPARTPPTKKLRVKSGDKVGFLLLILWRLRSMLE